MKNPIYTDTQLLDALRNMCGYVENGTDTTIRIFQDDATRDWCVRQGKGDGLAYGPDFRTAIVKAIDEFLAPDERPALPTPPTMLQRITADRDNLAKATQALKLFMMTDTYKNMEKVPQDMLAVQSRFMHGYLSVLEQRVNYYEDLV